MPPFVPKAPYQEGFVRWGQAPARELLGQIGVYLAAFPKGTAFWGAGRLWLTAIVGAAALVAVIIRARRRRVVSALLGAAFVLSPFSLAIVLGMGPPIRSLQALAVLLGGLWGLAFLVIPWRVPRVVLGLALTWLVSWQAMQINRLFFSEYLRWQADRDLANRILDRVYALPLPEDGPVPIVFVGAHRLPAGRIFVKQEAFGGSFFEWEGGNPWRIAAFLQTLGNDRLVAPDRGMVDDARRSAATMPCWPATGSVAFREGRVIVKLSESNGS